MTIAQQIGERAGIIEAASRRGQFVQLCRFLMLGSRGAAGAPTLTCRHAAEIARAAGVRGPVLDILEKAAVSAGGFGSWASQFADYRLIGEAFAAALVNAGIFDRLLGEMVPIPVATATVGAVSVGSSSFVVGEASAKQITRLPALGDRRHTDARRRGGCVARRSRQARPRYR
jgi:hypothetical protein